MIVIGPTTAGSNEFQDNDLVCYCFKHTKKDIEEDYQENGYSKILEKLIIEKKNNGCNCEVKNPKRK